MTSLLASVVGVVDAALGGAAPSTSPPPPWLGWLAIVLMRQRARQLWHRNILDTKLAGLRFDGRHGDVPGLPGWRFYFALGEADPHCRRYVVEGLRQCVTKRGGDAPPRNPAVLFEPDLTEFGPIAEELRRRYPPDWEGSTRAVYRD